MWKKILLGLLLIFVAIQFIRQPKNLGPESSLSDLQVHHPSPPEVREVLANACYDCHSNRTRYPWYAEIQPVGWWLASHVKDGKRHLNFSEFDPLTPKRMVRKLTQCSNEVTEGDMPLTSYKLAHPEARLTDAQRKLLVAWFDSERAKIPAD